MGKLTLREIDRICTEFDEQWSTHQGFDKVAAIILDSTDDPESALKMAEELAATDLQRRWRAWSRRVFADPGQAGESILRNIVSIPGTREYEQVLAQVPAISANAFPPELTSQLRRTEWESRCSYGDLPDPALWWSEVPSAVQGEAVEMLVVSIHSLKGEAEFRCWGDVRVGRRARGESAPYAMTDSDPPKIVCAEGSDGSVSRDQIRLRVVSDRYGVLENESRNRAFRVRTSQGQFALKPGSTKLTSVPFRVELGDLQIDFSRKP